MVKKKRQTDAFEDGSSTDSSEEKTMHSPTAVVHCQHIKKSVDTSRLRKAVKSTGVVADCGQCKTSLAKALSEVNSNDENAGFEYDNTLWMCLKCGTQLCGRSKNQHALQHFKIPHSDSHALAMNTRSFVIWCYECDNEVKLDSRKFLHECVDIIKRCAQKPITANAQKPAAVQNIEDKILATWESIRPLVNKDDVVNSSKVVLPLPPVPPPPPIPGIAKRIEPILNFNAGKFGALNATSNVLSIADNNADKKITAVNVPALPRVRGLTNLGNTCFFNAVMQCLAQTPYLLDVLKESAEPGEEFILPGGTFKFKDDEDVELPMIKGTLSSWGTLTAALANVLEELQLGGGVFTPSKLFDKFCLKCPQFRGGEQHDSHELLRQLLESVRSEDLKRYQRVILQSLGYKDQDSVSDEMRQKCKIYGNQAADRILRPDQVFRGFLVSTLTCQSCYNVSSRHEYFLDLSLPVSVEKPQVPQRRRTSPENAASGSTSFFLDPMTSTTANDNALAAVNTAPTLNKAQLRKEKKNERKEQKAAAKAETAKLANRRKVRDNKTSTIETENVGDGGAAAINNADDAFALSSSSSYEQSDADVEDNLIDDNATENRARVSNLPTAALTDTNGNGATLSSPGNLEKRDDTPENMDKDSLDEDENDSGIVSSPAYTDSNQHISSTLTNGIASVSNIKNSVVSIGLSQKSATLVRTLSASGNDGSTIGGNPAMARQPPNEHLTAKPQEVDDDTEILAERLNDNLQLQSTRQQQQQQLQQKRTRTKRARTQSYSDWSTTIAPRFQCEDGECSVQSCLNNFTGVELMTGNNKVGCENCTKNEHANNEQTENNSKPKTVYTNATKQFLISSPPAVLILHLKRFQLGPRCIFRKLTRSVGYPVVLDIAPFCGSKVKNLPNIDRKQKKLLYALYGVVEHAGSMYGGHYTAYVKVRAHLSKNDKRWKFIPQGSKAELDQDDEQRKKLDELLAKEKARELRLKATNDSDDFTTSDSASNTVSTDDDSGADGECDAAAGGSKTNEASNVEIPTGKWYYVSDSLVQEVTEDNVLQAQAYLLFYERIY